MEKGYMPETVAQPLVSVIVLAYNVGKYIEECLQSVISQSYANLDIIVVINGKSSDNTEELVTEIAQSDNRIRIVYNRENSYLTDGRRVGMNAMKGKYFTHVDGDDCLFPDAINTLVHLIESDDVDIAIASDIIDYNFHAVDLDSSEPQIEISPSKTYLLNAIVRMDMLLHAKLYKTTLYKNNDITPLHKISLYEDKLLHFQLASYANRIIKSNEFIYFYRKNLMSIVHTLKYETIANSFSVNGYLKTFFQERGYFEDERFLLAYRANQYLDLYYLLTTGGLNAWKDYPKEVPDLLYSNYFNHPSVKNYIKQWKVFYVVLVLFRTNKYLGDFFGCRCLNLVRKIIKNIRNCFKIVQIYK